MKTITNKKEYSSEGAGRKVISFALCFILAFFAIWSGVPTVEVQAADNYDRFMASGDDLGCQVSFYGMDWYMIEHDSVNDTVTLLLNEAEDEEGNQFSSEYGALGETTGYENSDVKVEVDRFKKKFRETDAVMDVYLLNKDDAKEIDERIRRLCVGWLNSEVDNNKAYCVNSETGAIEQQEIDQYIMFSPALKLDLTKVNFDGNYGIFSVKNNNEIRKVKLSDVSDSLTIDVGEVIEIDGESDNIRWSVDGEDAAFHSDMAMTKQENYGKRYAYFQGSSIGETTVTVSDSYTNQLVNRFTILVKDPSAESYSVTYDANQATGGAVPADDTTYNSDASTVSVLGNTGNLERSGYTFAGWNTAADGSGTSYKEGDTFNISGNTTLYAQWTVANVPAANTLTYNGQPQALVTVPDAADDTAYLFAVTDDTSSPADSSYVSEIPQKTGVDTYYVWYKTTAEGSTPAKVTVSIEKKDLTIKAKDIHTDFGDSYEGVPDYVTVTGLCDGHRLNSVNINYDRNTGLLCPNVNTADIRDNSDAIVTNNYNIISENGTFIPTPDTDRFITFIVNNGSWGGGGKDPITVKLGSNIPKLSSGNIPAAGSAPDEGYKEGNWDVVPDTNTTIWEDTTYTYTYAPYNAAAVTAAPMAKNLTYTGRPQALVASGAADGGIIQYALGDIDKAVGNYSTSIPEEANAGTYYVWYKAVGDADHADSDEASIEVTITAKEIGLDWAGTELTYNGAVQAPEAWAIGLCGSDICNVTVTGGQKDTNKKTGVASYTASASAVDNANYKLPENTAITFTIVPKEVTVTWSDTTLIYNGSAQKPTAEITDGLVENETATVTVEGEKTDTNIKAGCDSYTAIAVIENANYIPSEATKTVSFTIQPDASTNDISGSIRFEGMSGTADLILYRDGEEYKRGTASFTDGIGNFRFEELEEGNYSLKITMDADKDGFTLEVPIGDIAKQAAE